MKAILTLNSHSLVTALTSNCTGSGQFESSAPLATTHHFKLIPIVHVS